MLLNPLRLFLVAITLCGALSTAAARNGAAPTSFIENKGQLHDGRGIPNTNARYLLPLPGMNVQLRAAGFSYDTYVRTGGERLPHNPKKPFAKRHAPAQYHFHRVDIDFIGAAPLIATHDEQPGADRLNYYNAAAPEGAPGVRHFGKVTYKEVWPHIDVEFLSRPGTDKPVEYNFILRPGARVSDIRLRYTGATTTSLQGGKLHFTVAGGTLTESIPASYWAESGEAVEMKYTVVAQAAGSITVGFTGVDEVLQKTLILDPNPSISWGTYYGGANDESGFATNTDAAGAVYLTGSTSSVSAIATSGAHQTTNSSGSAIAFLAKFNAAGTRQWATYYGTDEEFGTSVATGAAGAVYMTGLTASTSGISTSGAHQASIGGGYYDGMLVKFDSSGVRQWGTYYGGTGEDYAFDVAIAASGSVYIAGASASAASIASTGAHQTVYGGAGVDGRGDGFVAKFNSAGARLWATYYGGSNDDNFSALAVSSSGHVCAAGFTSSTTAISTAGAHQTALAGDANGVLVCFDSTGARQWGTYYGGANYDYITDVAVNSAGDVFVGGSASSLTEFGTAGTHQPSIVATSGFLNDGFVGKFSSAGVRQWGTYYGGANYDEVYGVGPDASGGVFILGMTESSATISTPGAYQITYGGGSYDLFLAKMNSTGGRVWGSYYGGPDYEALYVNSLTVSGTSLIVAGETGSSSGLSTPGSHQPTLGGSYDAFLARFTSCTTATPAPVISISAAPGLSVCAEVPITFTATGGAAGVTYQWLRNGTPVSGATSATYITAALADNDLISCIATATDTCGSAADTSNVLTVDIKPLPVPVITRTGTTFSTGTFSSYQWLRNGTPISGATGKNYTSSTNGLYRVIVTGTNGCSDTSAPFNFSLAIGDTHSEVAVGTTVFPNPASTELFIQCPVAVDAVLSSIDGRVVLRAENAKSLDLHALPNDLYLLRITDRRDGALIKVEKVVKQR